LRSLRRTWSKSSSGSRAQANLRGMALRNPRRDHHFGGAIM
jgi:hypothetical protein